MTPTKPSIAATVLAALLASASPVEGRPPESVLEQLRGTALSEKNAVAVRDLRVVLGPAALEIREGVVVPAVGEGLPVTELVFLGEAWLVVDPPDEIEEGQLELFTGRERLRAPVSEAVLVSCLDASAEALLSGEATRLEASRSGRAREIWTQWREGRERELLGVEPALWLHALGDPVLQDYFAGRFVTERHGSVLLWSDPESREQVGLGRFVPLDIDDRTERKARNRLHREQRRGRLLGVELEDVGHFDHWLSFALCGESGQAWFGSPAFRAEHYRLAVEVGGRDESIRGRGTIRVQALTGSRRGLRLQLHRDLRVTSLRGPDGAELPRLREGREVLAVLPGAPAVGESVEVEVEWEGLAFERLERGLFRLVDTIGWHPRVGGATERATYDVVIDWPRGLDLAASGRAVKSGAGPDGGQRERRVLDQPALGFSFEVGRFDWERFRVGEVEVAIAFDKDSRKEGKATRQGLTWAVRDALAWYSEVLGPYPLDRLTVVTAPRDFSQGLLGFITLSNLHLLTPEALQARYGIQDARTVVAHELAHQWWGNRVGFASYRDEWLSEGVSSWLALEWSRRIPAEERPPVASTSRLRSAIGGSTEDGRPIESLGPIVLGGRLDSSLSSRAHQAIVYDKGALVLNGLAARLGPERFLQALHAVVEVAGGKLLDTGNFFRILSEVTGLELQDFLETWVQGTGMPRVWYSSEFTKTDEGWLVEVQLEQHPSWDRRWSVEPVGESWDLRRRTVARFETGRVPLAVHFGLSVDDPARGRKKDDDGANAVLRGRLAIDRREMTVQVPVAFEPKRFTPDPRGQDFGSFLNLDGDPLWVTLARSREAAAQGRFDEAVAILRADEELLAGTVGERRDDEGMSHYRKSRLGVLDRIASNLALAELLLETGRAEEAAARLELVDRTPVGMIPGYYERIRDMLKARVALARGDGAEVLRLYRRELGKKRPRLYATTWGVVAAAARLTGDAELEEQACTKAEEYGVDVGALRASR